MSSHKFSGDSSCQIGNLLSGSWELAQKIFKSLSYREVSRLRGVCRTWADVGSKILEQHRRLHYLTVHPHTIPTTQGKFAIFEASSSGLFDGFFEHLVSKPRYCLAFCNSDWFTRTDLFSSDADSSKGNMTLLQYLRGSLPTTCEFGVVCASGVIGTVESSYQNHWSESGKSMNQEILSFLCGEGEKETGNKFGRLRTRASRGGRGSDGEEAQDNNSAHPSVQPINAVSSKRGGEATNQLGVGYSIEVERVCTSARQADAVALLLVPHHPGLHFKFFHLCDDKFLRDFRKENDHNNKFTGLTISSDEFNQLTGLSHQDPLKALLLFDVALDDGFTEAFVQAALVRQNHKLALGGGMADCLVTSHSSTTSFHSFGIAVSGPNITAASIVIPKCVTNPKTLVDYMKELKSCGLPEEQSVAFMFTCCGRGYAWYRCRGSPCNDYHNVETKAFRQIFPNTPVFGFFGDGEIGLTHLPKFTEKEEEEVEEEVPYKRRKKKVFHQFSTIVVLLSFL